MLYLIAALVLSGTQSPRPWWEDYVLQISQSFLVMFMPIIILIILFNIIVISTNTKMIRNNVAGLILLSTSLGAIGAIAIIVISNNNVWIIDVPNLFLLAGLCFGIYYCILFVRFGKGLH